MNKSLRLAALLAILGATTALFTGCAGSSTSQSTGEFFDDAAITTKVKAAFVQDSIVSAFDVGVDTFKGTVQLNGFVDTPEQAARAEQIARNVPGVMNVQNRLTVKGRTPPPAPAPVTR